jgi:hypothetical protein
VAAARGRRERGEVMAGSWVEDECMIGDRWGVSESETLRSALGLSVGDLIMARRQLLNFKQLAECHQGAPARHHLP